MSHCLQVTLYVVTWHPEKWLTNWYRTWIFYTISQLGLMLIERYTRERRLATVLTGPKSSLSLQSRVASIIAQCQTLARHSAFLKKTFNPIRPITSSQICRDQMTQYDFETRTEPQPLPVYQIWKWNESMQCFHLKRNLLNGNLTVSRKSTAVRQLLPSFPPMCYINDKSYRH